MCVCVFLCFLTVPCLCLFGFEQDECWKVVKMQSILLVVLFGEENFFGFHRLLSVFRWEEERNASRKPS